MALRAICGEAISGEIRVGDDWTIIPTDRSMCGQIQCGEWICGVGNSGVVGTITETLADFVDNEIAYDGNEEADISDTIDDFIDTVHGTIPPSFGTFTETIADFVDNVFAQGATPTDVAHGGAFIPATKKRRRGHMWADGVDYDIKGIDPQPPKPEPEVRYVTKVEYVADTSARMQAYEQIIARLQRENGQLRSALEEHAAIVEHLMQ